MPNYGKVTHEVIQQLRQIVGEKFVITSLESMEKYSHDHTEDLVFFPEVVVLPQTPEQISEVLKLSNKYVIPVTPRGAGTGLSGGALPTEKGILLSVERLNRIIAIDEKNLQATVEPGVITQEFQEAVKAKRLFYPPDPASKGSCFIGGNLAENSGGPKAVKYGVTSDYVLNLEVVLPTGEIIWTGANVLKNATGYNLTQLMVGSEGTLGIITKAVFKLLPHPQHDLLMLVPFTSAEEACKAVSSIFMAGVTPSAMELMEKSAFELGKKSVGDDMVASNSDVEAFLLIEVDGNDMDVLMKEMEIIHQVLEHFETGEILFADDAAQKERLWKIRRVIGEAVKMQSVYKEEDTVVPRAALPKLLKGVKIIGEKYGFSSICYGHAGDGNLHVNILKGGMSDEAWNNELSKGVEEIFELCVQLKGTISGEHGIGYVQKSFLPIVFSEKNLQLQQHIKQLFDPQLILNPNKIFP